MQRSIHARVIGALATVAAALGLAGCPSTPAGPDQSQVRVVHLSPDAPAIDAFVGSSSTPAVTGLAFAKSSGYVHVDAGSQSILVSAAGAGRSQPVLTIGPRTFTKDARYTAVAFGKLASLKGTVVADADTAIPSNKVRVRAIHAAEGIGAADVWDVTNGTSPVKIASGLDYGQATATVDIDPGAHTLGLDLNADATPDVIFSLPALTGGTYVDLFAAVDDQDNPFMLVTLPNGATTRVDGQTPAGPAAIRVIHLSPDAPAVDVFVNQTPPPVFTGLAYKQSSDYATVAAGTYRVDVTATGSPVTSPVLTVPALALAGDTKTTAIAYGPATDLKALAITDDDTTIASGMVRVRAIHVAQGVGTVDVWNVTDPAAPTPLFQNLAYGSASATVDIPAAAYDLGVDADQDGIPDLYFHVPALPAGIYVNAFAVSDTSGVSLVGQLPDGTTLTIPSTPAPTGTVVHLSPDAPAVDVWLDGSPTSLTDVAFGGGTSRVNLPVGTHTIDIVPTGMDLSASVLTVPGVTFAMGQDYTIFAYGPASNLGASVLVDDLSAPPAGQIRVRAIHAALGVGPVDIWNVTDPMSPAILWSQLDYGAASTAMDLPAAAYTLGIDVNADATPDLVYSLPAADAGSVLTVFAVAPTTGPVELLVQGADGSTAQILPKD